MQPTSNIRASRSLKLLLATKITKCENGLSTSQGEPLGSYFITQLLVNCALLFLGTDKGDKNDPLMDTGLSTRLSASVFRLVGND